MNRAPEQTREQLELEHLDDARRRGCSTTARSLGMVDWLLVTCRGEEHVAGTEKQSAVSATPLVTAVVPAVALRG